VDYALLPGDINAVLQAARSRGLGLEGPFPGGRARPDGARLEWQTARSPRPDVPFLCADITPRALRVQEGEVRRHANGVTGIAALTVVVEDLEQSLARYAAYLGRDLSPEATLHRAIAGLGLKAATFPLGATSLTLVTPLQGAAGPVAETLATRGEGLFAAAFRAERSGPLDPSLTHGARLEFLRAAP
jgi:hypothetical protein